MSTPLRRGPLSPAAIGEPVVGADAGSELMVSTAEPFAPEDVHVTAVP